MFLEVKLLLRSEKGHEKECPQASVRVIDYVIVLGIDLFEKLPQSRESFSAGKADRVIEMRIGTNEIDKILSHHHIELGFGKLIADTPDERRRHDDVTQAAKSEDEDFYISFGHAIPNKLRPFLRT